MGAAAGSFSACSARQHRARLKNLSSKVIPALLFTVVMAGCTIHPVQQDVTNVPPKLLVDRIRCEARLAVIDKALVLLRDVAENERLSQPALAAKFDALARNIEDQRNHSKPIKFDPRDLPTATAKSFYRRYINTVIAYDFLMQGVENNRVALAADPLRLITNGAAGIALGGSSELMRDNQRHFALADTFGELLELPDCYPDYIPESFVYPISGSVGLREVVDTFIELNEAKPLSVDKDAKTVFADILKFTTTLAGSATPHIQIDPVGAEFGLASPTNIGLSASRADTHTLTVGLAMGPPQSFPLLGVPLIGLRAPAAGSTKAAQANKDAAFQAIQELTVRSYLNRAGTLNLR